MPTRRGASASSAERRREPKLAVPRSKVPRLKLAVQVVSRASDVPGPRQLRRWAKAALLQDAVVTLRIVGSAEGRRLNRDFRGKDYATNVLTFRYADLPSLAGDIVLCAGVVRREARERGIALHAHYAHLVVHGMLHLQGYHHARSREARRMERTETEIVARLGYADPYSV